jgi:hypothetical protein
MALETSAKFSMTLLLLFVQQARWFPALLATMVVVVAM